MKLRKMDLRKMNRTSDAKTNKKWNKNRIHLTLKIISRSKTIQDWKMKFKVDRKIEGHFNPFNWEICKYWLILDMLVAFVNFAPLGQTIFSIS